MQGLVYLFIFFVLCKLFFTHLCFRRKLSKEAMFISQNILANIMQASLQICL